MTKFRLVWILAALSAVSPISPIVAPTAAQAPTPATYITEKWQILPAIENNRPVFSVRALSKDELAEVKRLSRGYAGVNMTKPNLLRLLQLGESGDRTAMLAARDALAMGVPYEIAAQMRLDNVPDQYPMRDVFKALSALWTAHIWNRHGYEEAGRIHVSRCLSGIHGVGDKHGASVTLDPDGTIRTAVRSSILGGAQTAPDKGSSAEACGFTLIGQPAYAKSPERNKLGRKQAPAGATIIKNYSYNGGSTPYTNYPGDDFTITGAQFSPILGDPAFVEQKFWNHLKWLGEGLLINEKGESVQPTNALDLAMPFYRHYASVTGQMAALTAAETQAGKRKSRLQADTQWRKVDRWNSALAAYNADPTDLGRQNELSWAAADLGGEYLEAYRRLVPKTNVAVAGNQTGNAYGGAGFGSRQVEVRSYDQNGNYTGSTTTSAAWADIMKMTSPPPR